jgi:hypothetical protein
VISRCVLAALLAIPLVAVLTLPRPGSFGLAFACLIIGFLSAGATLAVHLIDPEAPTLAADAAALAAPIVAVFQAVGGHAVAFVGILALALAAQAMPWLAGRHQLRRR